jgi:hypothetical protein
MGTEARVHKEKDVVRAFHEAGIELIEVAPAGKVPGWLRGRDMDRLHTFVAEGATNIHVMVLPWQDDVDIVYGAFGSTPSENRKFRHDNVVAFLREDDKGAMLRIKQALELL